MAAARWPARSEPANNQLALPMAHGRIWFSTQLCRFPDYAASRSHGRISWADPCSGSLGLSALSKALQEGKQGVGRFVTRRRNAARIGVRKRAFLEPHVGVQVDLGRLR